LGPFVQRPAFKLACLPLHWGPVFDPDAVRGPQVLPGAQQAFHHLRIRSRRRAWLSRVDL